jgi:hypothetical protein
MKITNLDMGSPNTAVVTIHLDAYEAKRSDLPGASNIPFRKNVIGGYHIQKKPINNGVQEYLLSIYDNDGGVISEYIVSNTQGIENLL